MKVGETLGFLAGFILAAVASAQTVSYSIPNVNYIPQGGSLIYAKDYVAVSYPWGLHWLNTVTSAHGIVSGVSKNNPGYPSPASGAYVTGDCWGYASGGKGDLGFDGTNLYSNNQNGQCNGTTLGIFHSTRFVVGSFAFDRTFPIGSPINQTRTQTTDSQGRTWKIAYDASEPTIIVTWSVIGGTTPTPSPSPTPTAVIPHTPVATPTPGPAGCPVYVLVTATPTPVLLQ